MGYSVNNTGVPITNRLFLEAVFKSDWEHALICGFPGDPESKDDANWVAYPAWMLPDEDKARTLNMYFCPSLVTGTHRTGANFLSCHVIVVDDYGTKVDAARADRLLGRKPNYVIETSPGNYQAGWLMTANTRLRQVKNVLGSLHRHLGAGDNLADPMVWRRLPVGINGKAKYRLRDGTPFHVRISAGSKARV